MKVLVPAAPVVVLAVGLAWLGSLRGTTGTLEVSNANLRDRIRAAASDGISAGGSFRKLISVMKKSDQSEDSDSDPAIQAELVEVLDLLYRLDGNQIRGLIGAIKGSPDFDDDSKEGVIAAAVMILGTHHPSSAAAIFTGSPGLLEGAGMRDQMLVSIVIKWGEQDPLAAFNSIRAHQAERPDLIEDDRISALISGAAARNPKLAFQFIKDLGIEDSSGAIYNIGAAA
jgi:hypothetical protein